MNQPQVRHAGIRAAAAMMLLIFLVASGLAGAAGPGASPKTLQAPDALSPAMKRWAHRVAGGSGSDRYRSQRLLTAALSHHGLDLKEVVGPTVSAKEVFRTKMANCVSLAHLLVAMGREVDLPLQYAISGGRSEPTRARSARVSYGHLIAFLPGPQNLLLDFGGVTVDPTSTIRPISDREAQAVFFSNLGAEALLRQRSEAARQWLEVATRLGPEIPSTWLNFGVALRRTGHEEAARMAYRRALQLDREFEFARNNFELLARGPSRSVSEPDDFSALSGDRALSP